MKDRRRREKKAWGSGFVAAKNEENSIVMEKASGPDQSKQFQWKEIKMVWKCRPLWILKRDRKPF